MPIGACLAAGAAAEMFEPGRHASTFGGNPLACAAALAVIDTVAADALCERATDLSQRLQRRLEAGLGGLALVRELRAFGLMLGIALERPAPELGQRGLERGALVNMTAQGTVLRLLPPLIMSDAEADQLADIVIALVQQEAQRKAPEAARA